MTVTPVTVTPVTYIRPNILIFTGVIHKEGNASDSDIIRPDILIFTGVIHKEGNASDSNTSDIHKT